MIYYLILFLILATYHAWISETISDYYHRKRLKNLKSEMNRTYGYHDTDE